MLRGLSASTRHLLLAMTILVLPMGLLPHLAQDVVQTVVELGSMAMIWWHLRTRSPLWTAGVALAVAGVSINLAGDLATFVVSDVFGESRDSGPRDVLVVVGYVVLAAGAFLVARRVTRAAGRGGWIEAGIFGVGGVAPILVFVVLPAVQQRLHGGGVTTVTVYAMALVLLVIVLARLLLSDAVDASSLLYACLSGTVTIAADFVAAVDVSNGHEVVLARMLWMFGYVLFAAGLLHPSLVGLLEGTQSAADAVSPRRSLLLLTTGLVVPAASLTLGLAIGYTPHLWVIAGIALVVSLLVAQRIVALVARVAVQSEQLASLARSDELTGLPNRRSWNYELPRACEEMVLASAPLAVAMFDLDSFKAYNDEHGHQGGDMLLRATAQAWAAALRPGEYLSRYGGEEFVMLLRHCSLEQAGKRVEELRRLVPAPSTASAGVATWLPGTDPVAGVAAADAALYDAKRAGRDRTVVDRSSETAVLTPSRR